MLGTAILGAVGGNLVDEIWPWAKEKVGGDGPLRIHVTEDPQGGSDGFTTAMRSPAGLERKLGRAGDCDSLFEVAKAAGAVDVKKAIYNLVLEGSTYRSATITGMRARIIEREGALRGARVSCASAAAEGPIRLAFNLDERTPLARATDANGRPGKPYFASGNVVNLEQSEVQPLQLTAVVSRGYVEWEIEAEVLVDGEPRKVAINHNGAPFRITGPRPLSDYAMHAEWVWRETPQRLRIAANPPD